jgi:two-component system, LytTR family, sensor kinase
MPAWYKRFKPRELGILPPSSVIAAILVLLAILSGTTRRIAFVIPEGATGVMRVRWPWWRAFLISLGDWISFLPMFLILAWIVRSSPLEKDRWRSSLFRHLLAVLVLVPFEVLLRQFVYALINTAVSSWGETHEILSQTPFRSYIGASYNVLIVYVAMAALFYAMEFRHKQREKEHRALLLERQLAQTQLHMLRMQLNPHFLFNTLNALGSLMRKDVEMADEMLVALTEFLRSTLKEHGALEAPLEQELALAERYLQIERIRFPGRLALEVKMDPRTLTVPVPSFILQPLVENAIRHGLAPRTTGGQIRIQATLENQMLHLVVEDDGLGAEAPSRRSAGHGLGLSNTRERVLQRYGTRASMEAAPLPEGGFRVSILIPMDATILSELDLPERQP